MEDDGGATYFLLVAKRIKAIGFYPIDWGFESLRADQILIIKRLHCIIICYIIALQIKKAFVFMV